MSVHQAIRGNGRQADNADTENFCIIAGGAGGVAFVTHDAHMPSHESDVIINAATFSEGLGITNLYSVLWLLVSQCLMKGTSSHRHLI